MSHHPRATRSRARHVAAAAAVVALAASVISVPHAYADPPSTTHVTLPGIILTGIGTTGVDAIEAYEAPASEGGASQLTWCTQIWSLRPTAEQATTGIDRLVSTSHMWGPSEVDLTTPQMAWLLDRVNKDHAAGKTISPTEVGAVGYLVHANFEMSDPDTGHPDAQANVDLLTRLVQQQKPEAWARAVELAAHARASAATGYTTTEVPRDNTRHGVVHDIGVTNSAGGYVPNIPMRIVLSGPAVFDETGTKEWTGTSAAEPLTLAWTATGNGEVRSKGQYKMSRSALTHYLYGPGIQNTIAAPHGDPEWSEAAGRAWHVRYDFQPVLVSDVGAGKVSADGSVTDTVTVSADRADTNPEWKWIVDDAGAPVPVVFVGRAYDTGEHPAPTADSVPADARLLGEVALTANGPGHYSARLEGVDKGAGFVTWVWSVDKASQTQRVTFGGVEYPVSDLVHANWSDHYGLPEETLVNQWSVEVDSSINTHTTKRGLYLSDDLFVTGFPTDHPDWEGGHGFSADVKTLDQTLLFFPDGLDVVEANTTAAHVIGRVTVPARNGFYPHVGSTQFKVTDNTPGTYVFVTSFKGDNRVKPFTSSVEDVTEQYVVEPAPPSLATTATDKSDGDKTLATTGPVTITDHVCYTNLKPGKEYVLTGMLMDKTTEHPVLIPTKAEADAEGDTESTPEPKAKAEAGAGGVPVTSSVTFTPEAADGCVDVEFTVEASLLAGKTTVVFERLEREGKTIAVHTDIDDEGQTLQTPPIDLTTTASDKADGDKTLTALGEVTIVDHVCYTNLVPGLDYTLAGTLMDKTTGHPLPTSAHSKDGADSTPVTASVPFTPTKADGCVDVEFTLSASGLHGKTLVVFESLTYEGREIASHADIEDEGQSVRFVGADSDSGLAATGVRVGVVLLAALVSAVGGVVLLKSPHARARE